jgi:hypothetical protein
MKLIDQKREQIIDAAYEWRAAVVHRACCSLNIRGGNVEDAKAAEEGKLKELMLLLDHYRSDLTTLDYVVEL